MKEEDLFNYFKDIANERVNLVSAKSKVIEENIVRQMDMLTSYEGTALNAYLSKKVKKYDNGQALIYPYGVNKTQLEAVKNAFISQISVIEGPPGTGKTQTILNIIANIAIRGETCALVSNNNSAVENVYEKLEKKQLDFLIAKLGSCDKKADFFQHMKYQKPSSDDDIVTIDEITNLLQKIERNLDAKNQLAQTINDIKEIEIEKGYLNDWLKNNPDVSIVPFDQIKLSSAKSIELLAYLRYLSNRNLSFKDKLELLIHYRIFKNKTFNDLSKRQSYVFSLQLAYYNKLLKEKSAQKNDLENRLNNANYEADLKQLETSSLAFLYEELNHNMPDVPCSFNVKNYKKDFDKFLKCFPVIGSSTHSLVNSIASGSILDYVIIDEASQQDLVPGILCLGCAKNIIIVGDRKQLPHIPMESNILCPSPLYDCVKYSLLDSVCEVFKDEIPRTLLREHYRCQPKIIQFCNKQFYDNQLIPMTKDTNEDSLRLIITSLGNHMRHFANEREIDSVLKANESCGFLDKETGFIAPYNSQKHLAEKSLPEEILKDTIHKFQGRECNNIVFSTVLDKKQISQRSLNFVDDPALVNVAVSRAIDSFTLVTGQDVFTRNNKHIAALIRYIEYYGSQDEIFNSPVISAFDLLYTEYDKSLEKLNKRLNPKDSKYKSEQIVALLLRDVLFQKEFETLLMHKQVYLRQLVSSQKVDLTQREIEYLRNGASCDFVVYFKIGNKPMAVIEVDGGYHAQSKQIERDQLKNHILEKADIPLLRLPTTTAEIKDKIIKHLNDGIARSYIKYRE